MRTRIVLTVVVAVLGMAVAALASETPEDLNNAGAAGHPDALVVGGADRYETAANIALQTFPQPGDGVDVLYIANGETLVDSLVIGVTNETANKMLLVRHHEVPAATRTALEQLVVNKVVFLGGDAAISPAVRDEVMATVETY